MEKDITIIGAGLVGSLLAILLAKEGFTVSVLEKRPNPLTTEVKGGRSINLALSHRGIKALKLANLDQKTKDLIIPMKGRMVHDSSGSEAFLPYGDEGQEIYSISRSDLNALLIKEASEKYGVAFLFNHHLEKVDDEAKKIHCTNLETQKALDLNYQVLFGADGVFSSIHSIFKDSDAYEYSQETLDYGYKELHIPDLHGNHQLTKNSLHIWPRENFMLIALPNMDGSFTLTLFLPLEGGISFEQLHSDHEINAFFKRYFEEVLNLTPNLLLDFKNNPTSNLVSISCFPWVKEEIALIGDAAHGIAPFYGQGMNAGFEDCFVLMQLLHSGKHSNWHNLLEEYQNLRKENADAIAKLALQNFVEMRDLVADPRFLLRKKIESRIHKKYKDYLPLYTMVTFSEYSYKQAYDTGLRQDALMEKMLQLPNIEHYWNEDVFWEKSAALLKEYFYKK